MVCGEWLYWFGTEGVLKAATSDGVESVLGALLEVTIGVKCAAAWY